MSFIHKLKQTHDGVLFLQGVFKKDCSHIEDMFQNQLLHEDQQTEVMKSYEKIPIVFTSLSTWSNSTNLLCWHCHRTFKGRPWFEPQSIEPVSEGPIGVLLNGAELKKVFNKKNIFVVTRGNFCRSNCVRSYIDLNTHDLAERINKINMLKFIYEIFTGQPVTNIYPAPPPTDMIQYGGSLTTNEYQQKLDSLERQQVSEQ